MSNVEPLSGAAFNAMMEEETKESLIAMLFKEWREKDAARERIAELEAALTFYADGANWRTRGHPQIDAHDTAVNFDRGATARNAIRPQPWCTDPVACRAAGRCPHDPVCGN